MTQMSKEEGSGVVASIISMTIALTLIALLLSTFELASTKIRSSATANDVARLIGGYQFRSGAIDQFSVDATLTADLGSLNSRCSPTYIIGQPESKVTITCQVKLLSFVPIIVTSSSLIWN